MENYKQKVREKMDSFVHDVYSATKNFPKEEMYGVTSQIRRAALSIVLNYIEGYARRKKLVQLNFFEISFGSLKETKYLLSFIYKENYIDQVNFLDLDIRADELGAILWTEIQRLEEPVA